MEFSGNRLHLKVLLASLEKNDIKKWNQFNQELLDAGKTADLRNVTLLDTKSDNANLTGIKIYNLRKSGLSLKDVICERASWDSKGMIYEEYAQGEFANMIWEKNTSITGEEPVNPGLIELMDSSEPLPDSDQIGEVKGKFYNFIFLIRSGLKKFELDAVSESALVKELEAAEKVAAHPYLKREFREDKFFVIEKLVTGQRAN